MTQKRELTLPPVLVDKPFAMSSQEADNAITLAEEKKLILTCYQNRRWVSMKIVWPSWFSRLTFI
jgi:hypothetical protein